MDVLHIGALDFRWPDEVRRAVRAQALFDWGEPEPSPYSLPQITAMLTRQDELVDRAEDVCIWVDACLYDQLILCFLVDRLSPRGIPMQLICVDAFPGVPGFCGYGQLTPEQMRTLLPAATTITTGQIDAARLAWRAVATPMRSPQRLRAVANQVDALPFLGPALERFACEFQDAGGLALTERQILDILKTTGPATDTTLFKEFLKLNNFMGDGTFRGHLQRLVRLNLITQNNATFSVL